MSIADELRKLQDLREAGVLTEDEFARTKAAILASIGSPTLTGQVGDRSALIREQLDQFKSKFTSAVEDTGLSEFGGNQRRILEEYEDFLISLCGRDRYDSFLQAADKIRGAWVCYRRSYQNDYDDGMSEWYKKFHDEFGSLRRRVASIEYRC